MFGVNASAGVADAPTPDWGVPMPETVSAPLNDSDPASHSDDADRAAVIESVPAVALISLNTASHPAVIPLEWM